MSRVLLLFSTLLAGAFAPCEPAQADSTAAAGVEVLAFHAGAAGSIDEFDNLVALPRSGGQPRLAIGDMRGFLHVLEGDGDSYEEVWTSEYLEGAIHSLFVADVDEHPDDRLVVLTENGRIHYLDLESYRTVWSIPPSEYERITCSAIANVDDDDQPEILLCADGNLVVYDALDQFEEWISDQANLEATDLLIEDVDGDGADEIVLNSGQVFDAKFRDLEWQSPQTFGERMGVLDVDNDGIPELIGEFSGRYIKIFDIDLRREKSLVSD